MSLNQIFSTFFTDIGSFRQTSWCECDNIFRSVKNLFFLLNLISLRICQLRGECSIEKYFFSECSSVWEQPCKLKVIIFLNFFKVKKMVWFSQLLIRQEYLSIPASYDSKNKRCKNNDCIFFLNLWKLQLKNVIFACI